MGIILNFLLKTAGKAVVKGTTKAAKKAGDGAIKVAAKKTVAKVGVRVASDTIKKGVLHAQVTAPVRRYKRSLRRGYYHIRIGKVETKKEANSAIINDNVKAFDKSATEIKQNPVTYENELNRFVSTSKKLFARFASVKFDIINTIKTYSAYLDTVMDLPENIEFGMQYSITMLSTSKLKSLVKRVDGLGKDKIKYSISVALFGFKEDSDEDENIDFSGYFISNGVDTTPRDMENAYTKLNSYVEDLIRKAIICSQRYKEYINSLRRVFARSQKYLAVKKYVDSSYVRTLSVLDYINFDLLVDNNINEEKINSELRRKII